MKQVDLSRMIQKAATQVSGLNQRSEAISGYQGEFVRSAAGVMKTVGVD